jgi:hypothetical protein
MVGCASKKEKLAFDKDNGGLYLPDGFGAVVVIDSIGPSRHLAVKENGDIYVKLNHFRRPWIGSVKRREW